jgi:tetratricopeptide (TPR) repeat protein
MPPTLLKKTGIWLLVLLTLGSIASAQASFDYANAPFVKLQKKFTIDFSEPLIPNLTTLRLLSLGDRQLLADAIWLQTIQYFGTGTPYGHFNSLPKLMEAITKLDPGYEYGYEFSLVVLPFMNASDISARIGEQAQSEMKNGTLPVNGLLTYYLASVYQINIKDYKRAGELYEKASHEPGAPTAAKVLAGVSLSKVNQSLNDRLVAISFWKTVYDNAKNQDEKDRAKNWYENMQIVYAIEVASSKYKEKFGIFPTGFQDMVDKGYLPSIPESPIQREFILSPLTGRVSFDHLKVTN